MPADKPIRQEKKRGLSDKELIEKYEAGEQPVKEMVTTLLNTPNPNTPKKADKKR